MTVSSLPAIRSYDSPKSIVCLVFFLCAAFVTIQPVTIPVPVPPCTYLLLYHLRLSDKKGVPKKHVWHLRIDLNTGPVLAVLILLASKSIGVVEFRAGIKGVGDVHPYDILLLFLSLAYIAISLDATGALRFLAFWVAKKGGTSGWKLYFYLYLFFIVLGGVVGNDPVILSGTAFLAYFTKACGMDPPTAWIFAEFMAANLTSMVFVSSNPTNLVISSASEINFIYFSGWTIIPAILSSCALYPILMLQFFSRRICRQPVPRILKPPEVEPLAELKDFRGAVFKGVLLAATLVTLIVANVFVRGLYVWWVTVPAAVLACLRDVMHDLQHAHQSPHSSQRLQDDEPLTSISNDIIQPRPAQTCDPTAQIENPSINKTEPDLEQDDLPQKEPKVRRKTPDKVVQRHWSLPMIVNYTAKRFPTVYSVAMRMPWALLLFAFSFFILVDSLSSSGWISVWAGWLNIVVRNNDVVAIFFTGFICIFLCNISTNIGATLILTNIIYDENFASKNPSSRVQYGALFAIAVCSNIGAYSFVFPASLAGLLWRNILKQKGIEVRGRDFVRYNLVPLVVTTAVALAVVVAEVRVIFPEG